MWEGRRVDGVDPATGSVRPGAGGHSNGEPEVEADPDTTGYESVGRSNGEAEAEEEAFQFVSQLQDLPEHEIHRALLQRHREQLDLMVARHYGGEAGPTPLVPPLLGPGLSFEDAEGGDHSGEEPQAEGGAHGGQEGHWRRFVRILWRVMRLRRIWIELGPFLWEIENRGRPISSADAVRAFTGGCT